MTVLDPRPWAPASGHIGPDDDDLALLDNTGDAEVDLGSAVLAVHRVGGAAAEAVARAPLPDEYRLIDALARAREEFAPRAVEAVSKCLGRDDVYPDLLLKDLFDAGEAGALTVYRACVSKGVAPPLAVQRAGLVYGVPQDELGRYLSVVADPRAHPVAIADAADRAVTHWAAGVVRGELAEPVSKAVVQERETVDQYNQTMFGREHPKDSGGRFVDVLERQGRSAPAPEQVAGRPAGFLARLRRDGGVGEQAAPEVATAPVQVTAPPAVAQPVKPRTIRSVRSIRSLHSEKTQSTITSRIKSALRSQLSAKLESGLESVLDSVRDQPTGQGPIEEKHYDPDSVGDAFGKMPNITLAWALPVNRANEIWGSLRGAGTQTAPKHTQMGNLQAHLAEPYRWEHSDHEDTMQAIADEVSGPDMPAFVRISRAELESAGVSQAGTPDEVAERVRRYAEMAGYYHELSREPDGTINPLARGMMGVAPSAKVGTLDWYLVRHVEPEVYDEDIQHGEPMAAEFVIAGDTVRGNVEGGPDARSPYYELDPSQHYVITARRVLWRETGPETGYWVDRYTVMPMDEWREETQEYGKAAAAVAERWRTEPRNELGEWTSGGFLARVKPAPAPVARTVVEPVVTPIKPRQIRRQRQIRNIAPVDTKLKSTVTGQVKARLNAQLRSELEAALAARQEDVGHTEPNTGGYPLALDDRPIHKVMTRKEWLGFHKRHLPNRFADDIRPIDDLSLAAGAEVMSGDQLTGEQVDEKVRRNLLNQMLSAGVAEKEIKELAREIPWNDDRAWDELLSDIDSYMKSHPEAAVLRVAGDDKEARRVKVYVNKTPVAEQYLVYLPDEYDPDLPVRLVYLGKARRDQLRPGTAAVRWDPSVIVDAPVYAWRAEQQIWRAEQPDQKRGSSLSEQGQDALWRNRREPRRDER